MSLAKPWIVLVGLGLLAAWVATPALSAPQTCFGHQATLIGTKGDDRIVGTAARDVIVGRAGDDTVRSLEGNDLVCGGSGWDRLILGAGADKGKGERGDDLIKGLGGRDLILGGRGGDFVGGLYGGRNRDQLVGGRGDDYLEGGSGDDVSRAGQGFDLMIDGAHAFDDKYFGGGGFDNVRWIGGSPVTVDLRTGQSTGHGSDTLVSIEHIDGGEGSDALIGNGEPNVGAARPFSTASSTESRIASGHQKLAGQLSPSRHDVFQATTARGSFAASGLISLPFATAPH